jgi:uridine kinase
MITVRFPSSSSREYDSGIPVVEMLADSELAADRGRIIAVRVNNEIVSLSYRLVVNCTIEPIMVSSLDGAEIYRRTLTYVFQMAAREVLPHTRLLTGLSIGHGYFHFREDGAAVEDADCAVIGERMQAIVAGRMPIVREALSYQDAIATFGEARVSLTALLLRFDNRSRIPVYRCGSFLAPSHGPLLPHTGLLAAYEVRRYQTGLLVRFPLADKPEVIPEFKDDPLLFAIYNEHAAWERVLTMNSVGRLNEIIDSGGIHDVIHVAEALQNKKIARIAEEICGPDRHIRLVLIAGPSSSGKTTMARKLSIELRAMGRDPVALSVDDYFLPRTRTPLGADGKPDFEALEAVDVELLNEHLKCLLSGEEVAVPRYDFVTGGRGEGSHKLRLRDESVLVVEGIHALNDRLTPLVPRANKFKIYVSAITQIALDNYTRIPTTDNRLIRRMVRDYQYRGHSALQTLRMWPSVRRGEDRNIFPYQNTADAVFNSALVYELAVLKVYAEPLLRTIKPDVREYSDARRLLYLLSHFSSITPTWVPSQSILREFVGGSEFHY